MACTDWGRWPGGGGRRGWPGLWHSRVAGRASRWDPGAALRVYESWVRAGRRGRHAGSGPRHVLRVPHARTRCGGAEHVRPTTLLMTFAARPCRGPRPAPRCGRPGVETLSRSVGSLTRVERGGGRIGHCACALRALYAPPSPPPRIRVLAVGCHPQGGPVLLSLLWRISDEGSQREVNFSVILPNHSIVVCRVWNARSHSC